MIALFTILFYISILALLFSHFCLCLTKSGEDSWGFTDPNLRTNSASTSAELTNQHAEAEFVPRIDFG